MNRHISVRRRLILLENQRQSSQVKVGLQTWRAETELQKRLTIESEDVGWLDGAYVTWDDDWGPSVRPVIS